MRAATWTEPITRADEELTTGISSASWTGVAGPAGTGASDTPSAKSYDAAYPAKLWQVGDEQPICAVEGTHPRPPPAPQ